jgi:hypothetical protein
MFRRSTPRTPRLLKIAAGLALVATLAAPGSAFAGPSHIVKVEGVDLDCSLESATAVGGLFAVTRDRSDGSSFAFVEMFVEPNDAAAPVLSGGMDDPAFTPAGIAATFDMFNDVTGEPLGSATVSATFTVTGSQRLRRVYQNAAQMGIFDDLSVSGTITVTTAAAIYQFDLAGCDAGSQSRMDQIHDPNGPKPGGKAPANDTPAGALTVAAGSQVQMQTGGASLGSEAPCLMTFDGEVFDFSLGRTVWFALQGTGGPIVVDTGGSNFDTVVATYTGTGSGLEQVACVDDDPIQRTPQSRVTIDTELGVTYLVQIGGVTGNFGSEDPEFGRLRLNVN